MLFLLLFWQNDWMLLKKDLGLLEVKFLFCYPMTSFASLTFLQGFGNASLKATGNDTNGKVPVCISVNESLFYFICIIECIV